MVCQSAPRGRAEELTGKKEENRKGINIFVKPDKEKPITVELDSIVIAQTQNPKEKKKIKKCPFEEYCTDTECCVTCKHQYTHSYWERA